MFCYATNIFANVVKMRDHIDVDALDVMDTGSSTWKTEITTTMSSYAYE